MQLFNNKERYGFISKLLHWSICLLFFAQFFLVYRRRYLPEDVPEKMQYILLHKSFGAVVLMLAIFMILFRHIGERPLLPSKMSKSHTILAKMVHVLLYLSMLIMPLSGVAMSQFSGYQVSFFGWFNIPTLFLENKALASICAQTHSLTSYAIIILVVGHTLAALYHHFVEKDNVLRSMTCDKL